MIVKSARRGSAARRSRALLGIGAIMAGAAACSSGSATASSSPMPAQQAAATPYLRQFHIVSQVAATVPANKDVNPYGVAVVPQTTGSLVRGNVLVSNFNDKANVQGTGTTIVQISPDGTRRQFAQLGSLPSGAKCPGGVGLTTALEVLPGGWVVVGSLPTSGGKLPAVNPVGCLVVLNSHGKPAETWHSPDINGPWDMALHAQQGHAALFVSSVLSRPASAGGAPPATGLCAVVRADITLTPGAKPRLTRLTTVGRDFPWRQDKAALIQGPTGLALSSGGTLYAASTVGNSISVIPNALTRTSPVTAASSVLTKGGGLNGPLGLTMAPNGHLIAVNGNNGNAVEVTPSGHQAAVVTLVPGGAGDLFGVTPYSTGRGLLFVNDGTNALDLFSS